MQRLFITFLTIILHAMLLHAQNTVTVSGTVTDASTGETIPQATVLVKGTNSGTVADLDGKYSISVTPDATLVFMCIGYADIETEVGSRSIIDIALQPDTQMIEEVVTIGYGTVRKSDLTGSVASVKGSDIVKAAGASVDKMLQGRIAGLTVIDTSNDSPEASVIMRIRGVSSINGSNSPLVVVDGVPFGDAGNLTSVNPNIIESIEVLKDASATAIYGSRGANGVIMITTRNGKDNHTDVWFSGKVGVGVFSKPLKYWKREDLARMAQTSNLSYENGGAEGPYMGKVFSDGVYYPSAQEISSGDWPYYTDWRKYVFRPSVTQDYNVGVEGSSKGSRYYAAIGYYDGQGMRHHDDYRKISADFSFQNKIKDCLTFDLKAGFVDGNRTYNMGTSYTRNPLWPVYSAGTYYRTKEDDYSNPVMIDNELSRWNKSVYTYLTARILWEICDGLTFTATGNGKLSQSRGAQYSPRLYSLAGDTYSGEGTVSEATYKHIQTDAFLTYAKSIGKNNFSAMFGGSWESRTDQSGTTTGRGFTNDTLGYETISSAETVLTDHQKSIWTMGSFFTRLNYDWDGKYFATFTARGDGSSKFADNHKWGFFPSGALSWRMDREPWIKSIGFFDVLKLRASLGLSGNQGISPYQTLELYGSDYFYDFENDKELSVQGIGYVNGQEGLGGRYKTFSGMSNSDLTWEKTSQTDIGFDMAFFKNRVEITADYYYKYTRDLLRQQYLAPSSGFDTVWVNDGEIQNQGFELSVTGRAVENNDWSLSLTGILSLNRNKVIRLGTNKNSGFTTDPNGISFTAHGGSVYNSPFLNVLAIGYPLNVFYGYKVTGITQDEIGDGTSQFTEPGEFKYVGLRDDGTFDDSQRMIIGDPNPKFTGSVAINFTHRCGVDFSVLMYGVYGNQIFSTRKLDNMSLDGLYWTEENHSRYYPKMRYNRSYYASSWSVEDGSYLRISNMTLGYTLPSGLVKWLKNLRVYLSASNPFVFYNNPEYDPEVGENGTGSPAYPKVCTITTGLEIKF
ncbi:MAG: TonB-dependent receptor [Bacteroidales bacterium]|nr:TonB-dependent receptor [Bacteroidales bacterium]